MSDVYYTDERMAVDACFDAMKIMQKVNENFAARVTKLKMLNHN